MIDNRKTAKKLLLINWSCFQNETITLGGSTLFTGVNGTGKSTILDAMSYLITANTEFNKAANATYLKDNISRLQEKLLFRQ